MLANVDEVIAENTKERPMSINTAPAILVIVFRSIFPAMNHPKYMAIIDRMVSATMTPMKNIQGSYSVANRACPAWQFVGRM